MQKRRRKSKYKGLLMLVVLCLGGTIIYNALCIVMIDKDLESDSAGRVMAVGEHEISLSSPHAILMSLDDDRVIYGKRVNERIYPASLTKMMTALVVIENFNDLDRVVTLPDRIFKSLYNTDASMAQFKTGERINVRDLLYGCMLPSGAEAALGLAYASTGSEESFVELMNEKAEDIGMTQTHFVNVTGLHDDNHYTTVTDMNILLKNALQNECFWTIFTTLYHETEATKFHPKGIMLSSTLNEITENFDFRGGRILGGKTGYTEEAGLCLASLAEKEGRYYIAVVAGAKGNHGTVAYHVQDSVALYERIDELEHEKIE